MSLIFQRALKVLITKKNKILNKLFVFSTVAKTFGVKIPERYYRLGVRL
jgi:ABC-type transport system involved in cytochrome c biogenesis permease component